MKSLDQDLLLAGSASKIAANTAVANIMQKFLAVQKLVPFIHQQPSSPVIGPDLIGHIEVNPTDLVHHLGNPVHIDGNVVVNRNTAQKIFDGAYSGVDAVPVFLFPFPSVVTIDIGSIDLVVNIGAGYFNIAVPGNAHQGGFLRFQIQRSYHDSVGTENRAARFSALVSIKTKKGDIQPVGGKQFRCRCAPLVVTQREKQRRGDQINSGKKSNNCRQCDYHNLRQRFSSDYSHNCQHPL